jgi:hypothetical protein
VAGVVYVSAVSASIVACMTVVRRSVLRVCAVSGLVTRVALVAALPAVALALVAALPAVALARVIAVFRGVLLVPVTVLVLISHLVRILFLHSVPPLIALPGQREVRSTGSATQFG